MTEARIAELEAEVSEICKELGCVQKPGVAVKFIKNLRIELQHTYARNVEIMRSWDDASPTELQELDRLRRGWGPSTPTERQARHADLLASMQAFSIALSDLAITEDIDVPEEAQKAFAAAYDRVHAGYVAVIELIQKMHEPIAKPDIDWEARAESAEARVKELEAGLERIASQQTAVYDNQEGCEVYVHIDVDEMADIARALLSPKDKSNG